MNLSADWRGAWEKRNLQEAWFCLEIVYLAALLFTPDRASFVMKHKPASAFVHCCV
jgi:hypothetical protein